MWLNKLFALHDCIFCQIDQAHYLGSCKFCESILPWIHRNQHICYKCQKILLFSEQIICTDCKENHQDFNKIFAIFSYADPIKKLLLDLKFRHKLAYANILGKLLLQKVTKEWYQSAPSPEAIIPVPLHQDRLRLRGFNQAFELSREIGKQIPVNRLACSRIKNTVSQISLLKNTRHTNIIHAFSAEKLSYKHIAILDDVITTGSTIKSLTKAIKLRNPNILIDVWCIARA